MQQHEECNFFFQNKDIIMSNQITQMKKRFSEKKDREKIEELKRNRSNIGGGIGIDFKVRVLPRTILVDVWTDEVFIGNDTDPIGQCEKCSVGRTKESASEFIDKIKAIEVIDKVIIFNSGDPKDPEAKPGFNIIPRDQFVSDIEKYVEKKFSNKETVSTNE